MTRPGLISIQRWSAAAFACAAAVLCPAQQPAVERAAPVRLLIDRSLKESAVRVVSIDSRTLKYTSAEEPATAPARSRPLSEVLAIIPAPGLRVTLPPRESSLPLFAVTTVDGQRVVGTLADAPEGKDPPIRLATRLVGAVNVPLDRARTLEQIPAPGVATEPGSDDRVVLTNADLIVGFVESVGRTISVQPSGGQSQTFESERVRSISFANQSKAAAEPQAWLADGSVLALSASPMLDGGVLRAPVALAGSGAEINAGDVIAVSFDPRRLRALAALPAPKYRPSADRRWTRPPRVTDPGAVLAASDIEIPGPMTIEWALPDGSKRLACLAELAPSSEGWGDCVFTIELETGPGSARPLFSHRLTPSAGSIRAEVALDGAKAGSVLRISIAAGEHGSVQDRVMLRRPLLLIEPPGQ